MKFRSLASFLKIPRIPRHDIDSGKATAMEGNFIGSLSLVLPALILIINGCGTLTIGTRSTREGADRRDPASDVEEAKELTARRLFDAAHELFDRLLEDDPAFHEALSGRAFAYYQAHDWEESAAAWKAVLGVRPDDRDAAVYRWDSMMKSAGEDSMAKETISARLTNEAMAFIGNLEGDREFDLSMAYYCLSLAGADSSLIDPVSDQLVESFPESKTTYEIVGNIFYDNLYPIWRNDGAKVEFLTGFVERYDEPNWMRTAYQTLFYSLAQLEMREEMTHHARQWVEGAPEDPWAYNTIAYWYLDRDIGAAPAREMAEKAVLTLETFSKPANYPPVQWEMNSKILYASARFNLAYALLEEGRLREAEAAALDAIENTGYGVNDEKTVGSCFYVLGRVNEKMGREEEAIDAYLSALILGDSRNRWTPKADSCFVCLYEKRRQANPLPGRMDFARERSCYRDIAFDDITESCGLSGIHGGRVAWGDYDGDGWEDLLVNGCRLFRNEGDGTFLEVTPEVGLEGNGSGGVWGDYDNDGHLDIFMISGSSDALWRNGGPDPSGTVRFDNVTSEAGGVSNFISTEGAGWADADGDGFLDLYLANYEVWKGTSSKPERDQFFMSDGDGAFTECLESAGMLPRFGEKKAGRGVNWGDFDDDGDQDCFVSNYRLQENFLWENDGTGHFRNTACFRGVAGMEKDGWWGHTIGSEWGDYDNDGDLDLVTANLAHPRYIEFSNTTRLYENTGPPDHLFVDRREAAGIVFEETHSDPSWGDVDGDGYLDLYLTSVYQGRRSFLYLNNGDGSFRDVTHLAGVRHLNGWGCAFCDYDRDGDLDLAVAGGGLQLLGNRGNDNHWLEVKVVGSRSNRSGIGTRITLKRKREDGADQVQIREVQGGKGTTNQHSMTQFFGLSDDPSPVELTVRFPSGIVRELHDVEPDQLLVVRE